MVLIKKSSHSLAQTPSSPLSHNTRHREPSGHTQIPSRIVVQRTGTVVFVVHRHPRRSRRHRCLFVNFAEIFFNFRFVRLLFCLTNSLNISFCQCLSEGGPRRQDDTNNKSIFNEKNPQDSLKNTQPSQPVLDEFV